MTKKLNVKGPNGIFEGEVVITSRKITKSVKNSEGENEFVKTNVYDVESFVNGQLFGTVSKNIQNDTIVEIEALRHEALLMLHLETLANKQVKRRSFEERMAEKGFAVESENKLNSLSDWIKEKTVKTPISESQMLRPVTAKRQFATA